MVTLPIQISVVNQSTAFADAALPALANALQFQVMRDFFPAWGVEAKLFYTPSGKNPTASHWVLALLDDADQAGALGYHDVTPTGQPLSKVFVKTTLAAGQKVEVTASHELLEMLADPEVNLAAQDNGNKFWAYEVGDPVENDSYQIVIPPGWNGAGQSVPVSNFALPSWWESSAPAPYDFLKRLIAPFTLTAGGYAQFIDLTNPSAGWQQVTARKDSTPRLEARHDIRWLRSVNLNTRRVSTYQPQDDAIPVAPGDLRRPAPYFVRASRNKRAILLAIQTDLAEVKRELKTMGDAITTAAASVEANFALVKTALTNIATGVTALDAQIQALKAQIAAGGTTLSAADQAALDQLVTDSAALAAQAQGISTAPPA